MLFDYQKEQELKDARRADQRKSAKNTLNEAKNLAKSATPWGAAALFAHASIGDWMYWLAIFAAILKDILDIIEFTGIGYIIVIVITICISIFIGMMMGMVEPIKELSAVGSLFSAVLRWKCFSA